MNSKSSASVLLGSTFVGMRSPLALHGDGLLGMLHETGRTDPWLTEPFMGIFDVFPIVHQVKFRTVQECPDCYSDPSDLT